MPLIAPDLHSRERFSEKVPAADILRVLQECIDSGTECWMEYRKRNGEYSERIIKPASFKNGRFWAYDVTNEAGPKGFSPDCIVSIRVDLAANLAGAVLSVRHAEFETDGAPDLLPASGDHMDAAGGTVSWAEGFTAIAGPFTAAGFSRAAESISDVCLRDAELTIEASGRVIPILLVPGEGAQLLNGEPFAV